LIKKEGKLQDYKGRLDDRIGVVRLRVKKQSHEVDWDCEVVEGLAGGESFVIGTDLAPQLGIWLEGVDTNLATSELSFPAGDTDGGQRLLRGVARFSAEENADLGELSDVPDELAERAHLKYVELAFECSLSVRNAFVEEVVECSQVA
jgi:hypothetical protein